MRQKRFALLSFGIVLAALTSIVSFPPAQAAILNVPGDVPTIQVAVDSVAAGDTVLVAAGMYMEDVVVSTDSITILSSDGPESTTIQGSVLRPGLDHGVLEGFTLTNLDGDVLLRSDGALSFIDCVIRDVPAIAQVVFVSGMGATFDGCTFRTNSSPSFGGAVWVGGLGSAQFTNCDFEGNSCPNRGGAVRVSGVADFDTCTFKGNFSTGHAGAVSFEIGGGGTFEDCVLTGNLGSSGGAIWSNKPDVSISRSTLTGNKATMQGGAVFTTGNANLTADQTIVLGNCADVDGDDLFLSGGDGMDELTCCILDPATIAGPGAPTLTDPVFADPLFCDPVDCGIAPTLAGAVTVHVTSPALALNNACSLDIGAGSAECNLEILSVTDVGNDQGKQVRVRWLRAGLDNEEPGDPVVSYAIWRRVEAGLAPSSLPDARVVRPEAFPPGEWDFVTSVPAVGLAKYSAVVPTLCDSTISEGLCYSTFVVVAQDLMPPFIESEADSGYSVDNLAPGVPENLIADFDLQGVQLSWDESESADFRYFRLYRGSSPEFVPDELSLIHETAETQYLDTPPNPGDVFYKLTAVDFSGNESEPTGSVVVVAVGEDPTQRLSFALEPNVPNPFREATRIAFTLAAPVETSIEVYDVSGRLVRTLVRAELPAGEHVVQWDGSDNAGRKLPPGIYFQRMRAGTFESRQRMVLMR